MRSLAALEVHGYPDGSLPIQLLHAAYRASRRGRIVLILNGTFPDAIDEAVDPLVHIMRLDIPGLYYVDGRDSAAVGAAVKGAGVSFKAHELGAAAEMLSRLARPTRLSEIDDDVQ